MSIEKLSNGAKGIGSFAIVIAVVLVILGTLYSNTSLTLAANTAVGKFIDGIAQYADWIGIIVIVSVGAYLLGMMGAFGKKE